MRGDDVETHTRRLRGKPGWTRRKSRSCDNRRAKQGRRPSQHRGDGEDERLGGRAGAGRYGSNGGEPVGCQRRLTRRRWQASRPSRLSPLKASRSPLPLWEEIYLEKRERKEDEEMMEVRRESGQPPAQTLMTRADRLHPPPPHPISRPFATVGWQDQTI